MGRKNKKNKKKKNQQIAALDNSRVIGADDNISYNIGYGNLDEEIFGSDFSSELSYDISSDFFSDVDIDEAEIIAQNNLSRMQKENIVDDTNNLDESPIYNNHKEQWYKNYKPRLNDNRIRKHTLEEIVDLLNNPKILGNQFENIDEQKYASDEDNKLDNDNETINESIKKKINDTNYLKEEVTDNKQVITTVQQNSEVKVKEAEIKAEREKRKSESEENSSNPITNSNDNKQNTIEKQNSDVVNTEIIIKDDAEKKNQDIPIDLDSPTSDREKVNIKSNYADTNMYDLLSNSGSDSSNDIEDNTETKLTSKEKGKGVESSKNDTIKSIPEQNINSISDKPIKQHKSINSDRGQKKTVRFDIRSELSQDNVHILTKDTPHREEYLKEMTNSKSNNEADSTESRIDEWLQKIHDLLYKDSTNIRNEKPQNESNNIKCTSEVKGNDLNTSYKDSKNWSMQNKELQMQFNKLLDKQQDVQNQLLKLSDAHHDLLEQNMQLQVQLQYSLQQQALLQEIVKKNAMQLNDFLETQRRPLTVMQSVAELDDKGKKTQTNSLVFSTTSTSIGLDNRMIEIGGKPVMDKNGKIGVVFNSDTYAQNNNRMPYSSRFSNRQCRKMNENNQNNYQRNKKNTFRSKKGQVGFQ